MKLGTYKHYQGKYYQVIGIAKHSETLEEMVVYQDMNDKDKIWVRPKKMFEEKVEVDGKKIPRFKLIK
ncbi:MAG: DUF1653 domain-containing protein [Candidatus Woesebacteria bacterium]|jgi:hypothetical protein